MHTATPAPRSDSFGFPPENSARLATVSR